ncbi:MAG: hypothetical protein SGPRY_014512 [Prymnesium sp.]
MSESTSWSSPPDSPAPPIPAPPPSPPACAIDLSPIEPHAAERAGWSGPQAGFPSGEMSCVRSALCLPGPAGHADHEQRGMIITTRGDETHADGWGEKPTLRKTRLPSLKQLESSEGKRGVGGMLPEGWTKKTYYRPHSNEVAKHVYRSPSGERFTSLKQAQMAASDASKGDGKVAPTVAHAKRLPRGWKVKTYYRNSSKDVAKHMYYSPAGERFTSLEQAQLYVRQEACDKMRDTSPARKSTAAEQSRQLRDASFSSINAQSLDRRLVEVDDEDASWC